MSAGRDEGPVYYREIQKNAYLKRIPNESSASKLLPLGHKKPPLKPMWTLFCVHNGRTPYLEQYPEAESPATLAHRPVWRACLRSARHVTASVRPRAGEYDFLVDTDHGPVRMLAPDWESMQDWVTTLRNKLHELKIVGKGENVYCAAPAVAPPRAAARDPTSPLPPTPPVPPDRVPGIELTPQIRTQPNPNQPEEATDTSITQPQINLTQPQTNLTQPQTNLTQPQETVTQPQLSITQPESTSEPQPVPTENIDISNWESDDYPSTSQISIEPKKSVAKICGQNICLDDSIFKRNQQSTDSDEEFFAEIDRLSESVENLDLENDFLDYKQRVVVEDKEAGNGECSQSSDRPSNITVIQVSNKPPHTAIPVLGPETNLFNFDFNVPISDGQTDYINIVNTETAGENSHNNYGTVFEDSDYGHISLTTTVNLTGDVKKATENGIYERLCMASTSNNENNSPLPLRKLKSIDKVRKSSLPNLDTSSDSTYEYLYPNNNKNTTVTLNAEHLSLVEVNSNSDVVTSTINSDITRLQNNSVKVLSTSNNDNTRMLSNCDSIRLQSNSDNTRLQNNCGNREARSTSDSDSTRLQSNSDNSRSINNSSTREVKSIGTSDSTRSQNNTENTRFQINSETARLQSNSNRDARSTSSSDNTRLQSNSENTRVHNSVQNSHPNLTSSVSIGNVDLNTRVIRSSVERSHSQNAYDRVPRREGRGENCSPKRNGKNDKPENGQAKPIWKRGLTELSLLSRLRAKVPGTGKKSESQTQENNDRNVTSPIKVVHRSRCEARVDTARRRSSSLSNGVPSPLSPPTALVPLRARQAAALRAELRRGAAIPAAVTARDPPTFVDYNNAVWIAWWGVSGARVGGRAGDRVAALRGTPPRDAAHARQLLKTAHTHLVDILFHRVPLAKIYVINKRDLESIGISLDNECNISGVTSSGLPPLPAGSWAVTEVNNRPINLLKGGEEEMNRLSLHGTEVSILIQPSALVKKIRQAIKSNKSILSLR